MMAVGAPEPVGEFLHRPAHHVFPGPSADPGKEPFEALGVEPRLFDGGKH